MEYVSDLGVLERLKIAAKTDMDAKLASLLGLSRQSITKARATKSVPTAWIPLAAKLFNVSTDWLYFGRSSMQPGDAVNTLQHHVITAESGNCLRCVKLEAKIESLENERIEVSKENRQCAAKIEQLLRENGDLRERCAKLEERRSRCVSTRPAGTPCIESA